MRSVWDTPLGQKRLNELREVAERARQSAEQRKLQRVASAFHRRMYAASRSSRLTGGWNQSNTSADSELVSSLTMMRSRSRALIRDYGYAKRLKVVTVNNIIGSGIGMQGQVMTTRGELNDRVNDEIEAAWVEWCRADSCHTGGRLHFANLERALMGQVFEAGEVFVRKHMRAFGNSRVPFALELIEAERLADDLTMPTAAGVRGGNQLRMGIEVDRFFRPVAYYFRSRHPSEVRWAADQREEIERVPADEVLHLAVVDRWPQTRGEPWLHAVMRRLMDMDGYSEAEIIRARSQAGPVGAIKTPESADSFGELQADGTVEMEVEPGVFKRLAPGEELEFSSPTAPNAAMDPFMRMMLREVAAGAGPSYESTSRDYSQGNYSSTRIGLLEDRDLWRVFQWWFIRDFRAHIHAIWLQQAVLASALTSVPIEQYGPDRRKFEAVRFKPRGWTWVDPTTEVEAYILAVEAGFTTVGDVIAQTAGGLDLEDVLRAREQELRMMAAKGLVFTTSPAIYASKPKGAGAPPDKGGGNESETDSGPPKAGRGVLGVVK